MLRKLVAFSFLLLGLSSGIQAGEIEENFRLGLREALKCVKMTPRDIYLRNDYLEPDSFRLSVVKHLLKHPLNLPSWLDSLGTQLSFGDLSHRLKRCGKALDLNPASPSVDTTGLGFIIQDGDFFSLPQRLQASLKCLLGGIRRTNLLMEEVFSSLNNEEREFLFREGPEVLKEGAFDPQKPIEVREKEKAEGEERDKRILELAQKVKRGEIISAGLVLTQAFEMAQDYLEEEIDLGEGIMLDLSTPWGRILVGGRGSDNYYQSDVAVIIDLGGEDRYDHVSAPGDRRAMVIIDLDGDDLYLGDEASFGGGLFGVGLLWDRKGDDTYITENYSMGAGFFGCGLLWDGEGDDRYFSDTAGQGAGAFGVGMLLDDGGNDEYRSALFSQGFAFVGGFGYLSDRGGNDLYFSGGKYTDQLRYFDHYLSLSQGFAYGLRPYASGGVALLYDQSGNDNYVSDIFGQGSSYWYSLSGLIDGEGNDSYISHQYAQGAATHLTLAALIDEEGDDNYISHGVSQGCGHDLSFGLLEDWHGDDNYATGDLSQGAGNANGIGIFFDFAGNDNYQVRKSTNTNGYGDFRRDYGSIGVFIDLSGNDHYAAGYENGSFWAKSRYGVGADLERPLRGER